MMKKLLSAYLPSYPATLVYMLQSSEYQINPYLSWYWRVNDFRSVMYRRQLVRTKAAVLLLVALTLGICAQIMASVLLIWLWNNHGFIYGWQLGIVFFLSYPVVWAHLIVVPLALGKLFIIGPRDRRLVKESKAIFKNHTGIKIAVAGSYGKTSMKELLITVLREGKRTVATPANKNVAVSHAKFARSLKGDEQIVIIEYGEAKPGDIAKFADTTSPDIAIITGLAPAHLDHYPTLKAAGEDIFSLSKFVSNKDIYVNADSPATEPFIKSGFNLYSSKGALGWKISNVKVSIEGISFSMKKGKKTLNLTSQLLGQHNISPLALAAALADKIGLTRAQIEQGIKATKPFEHRMQPRPIHGAWLIDDTYNGNIDGIRAGLALIKELPARRKIYVTPGLVDQGVETKDVHLEMGQLIAHSGVDSVVLMNNSVTSFIKEGLEKAHYHGGLVVEDDPLKFYRNIDQFVAAGDIVLMQNDWTDNYN